MEGVITSISMTNDGKYVALVESNENRLGRWTANMKVKPKIRVLKLFD